MAKVAGAISHFGHGHPQDHFQKHCPQRYGIHRSESRGGSGTERHPTRHSTTRRCRLAKEATRRRGKAVHLPSKTISKHRDRCRPRQARRQCQDKLARNPPNWVPSSRSIGDRTMQLPACGRAHSFSTRAQGCFHFQFPNPFLVDECGDETCHRFRHTLWLAVDAVSGRCQRTQRNRGRWQQGQTIQNLGTTVGVTSPRLT